MSNALDTVIAEAESMIDQLNSLAKSAEQTVPGELGAAQDAAVAGVKGILSSAAAVLDTGLGEIKKILPASGGPPPSSSSTTTTTSF